MGLSKMVQLNATAFDGATCVHCWRSPKQMAQFAEGKFVVCVRHANDIVASQVNKRESMLIMATVTFHPLPPREEWDKLGVKYGRHHAPTPRPKNSGGDRKPPGKESYPD